MRAADEARDCLSISAGLRNVRAPEEVDAAQVRSSISIDREKSSPLELTPAIASWRSIAAGSLVCALEFDTPVARCQVPSVVPRGCGIHARYPTQSCAFVALGWRLPGAKGCAQWLWLGAALLVLGTRCLPGTSCQLGGGAVGVLVTRLEAVEAVLRQRAVGRSPWAVEVLGLVAEATHRNDRS